MASDPRVIQAAKVSTIGSGSLDLENMTEEASYKFIKFLMQGRHGSPFEHCVFTFLVEAPIFVWREIMRHRIASYNEESGRYKELKPVFYIPAPDRYLIQEGKPGEYIFVPGSKEQYEVMRAHHESISERAYNSYQTLLANGIAREVARMSLPLNIYSSAYITINARSLMNFLSLRTKSDAATYPSFPQKEIEMVAKEMEASFSLFMPLTHEHFTERGRVAP